MQTIYKYTVDVDDKFTITTSEDAELLTLQMQDSKLALWFMVDTDNPPHERTFRVYGTGHEIDVDRWSIFYINTVQELGGALVWHVFEDMEL